MRREFKTIQTAFQARNWSPRLNKTWRELHEALEVGLPCGSYLQLSESDIARIRQYCQAEYGQDPFGSDAIPSERVAVAATGANEKLASMGVFASMVMATRLGGDTITLRNASTRAVAPPGTLLMVDETAIDTEGETLIVVENGAVLRHCDRLLWPRDLQGALLLYRGHGVDARAVRRVVSRGSHRLAAGFFDFDPAGLDMALNYGVEEILIPRHWDKIGSIGALGQSVNSPDRFWVQHKAMARLRNRPADEWTPVIQAIQEQEAAVMQEHMMAQGCRLISKPVQKRD